MNKPAFHPIRSLAGIPARVLGTTFLLGSLITGGLITGTLVTGGLIVTSAPALAKGDNLWFHLAVSSPADEEQVNINLPLSMAEKMLPMMSDRHFEDGRLNLDLNGRKMTVEDLRELWAEAKKAPEGEFITVKDKKDEVRIQRAGDYMLIEAEETDDTDKVSEVEIKIPVRVVDALLKGSGESLDLAAGIAALREHGPGELVSVIDGDETVRIWIDEKNASK
ncbi:MAG: hypothetical protein IPK72_03030 [Candidatus Eisenbacteria bacterium]|nr:hypothetical protein [Candidatus Eisenbacteria bacterium]